MKILIVNPRAPGESIFYASILELNPCCLFMYINCSQVNKFDFR